MTEIAIKFFKSAIPMILSNMFLQSTYFVNVLLAGQFENSSKLAGVGLGTTLLNVVLYSPLMGMNGAVETLVS